MFGFKLLILLLLPQVTFSALEYSKIEHPGCPENAYCHKATGEVRQKWIDDLERLNTNKISESKFNELIQKENGIPIASWAMEEAGVLPRIMMWDSPCKQHKKEATKFYISEIFRKNLFSEDLKNYPNLYFSRAIGLDQNKAVFSVIIPRGEVPLYSENGFYYFLREEDGKYYGLLVNRSGELKISKVQAPKDDSTAPAIPVLKDAVCTKEQIDQFVREAPSPSFYQSHVCRNIWDKTTKTFRPMLFGWSCN